MKSDIERLIAELKKLPAEAQKRVTDEWDAVYHGRFKSAIRRNPLTAVWYAAAGGAVAGMFVLSLLIAAFS